MSAVDTLDKSIRESRAVAVTAFDQASRVKASSGVGSGLAPSVGSSLATWQDQAKHRERYSLFRGWLYAAINAICIKAASQPVKVGSKVKKGKGKVPKGKKNATWLTMPMMMQTKVARDELDVIEDHPIVSALENPNAIQGRWQFVYSFIANLCLTGWAYVVKDEDEEGNVQFYSLPTTWVKPDHEEGPFSRFKVADPNKPESQQDTEWLGRDQVGFAHLPNPADPRSAYTPTSAQMPAIRIYDHIQTSRELFFENGVFPSVIVTVGKDPHPDVPSGIRPRLSPPQRREVYSMIRQTMGSVVNYGNPAIVDGMIEGIERLSMTNNEMGWDKSEESVKTSILSTFCVHPYILGEAVAVGGYAQVANIEKRFFERVNSYLDMMSNVVTNLVRSNKEEDLSSLLIWWERCEAIDPQQKNMMLKFARTNNDISQNEFRSLLGYAPDDDRNESVIGKGLLTGIVTLLDKVGAGAIQNVQAIAVLEGLGLPSDLAKEIAGPKVEKPEPPPMVPPGQLPPGAEEEEEDESGKPIPGKPKVKPGKEEAEDEDEATKTLRQSIVELRRTEYGQSNQLAKLVIGILEDNRRSQ